MKASNKDDGWLIGRLYFNREDKRVIIKKRSGFGYIMNLGNRWTWIFNIIVVIIIMLFLIGCGNNTDITVSGDMPPMITFNGWNYVAKSMPTNELPDGWEYIGELTEEQANDTGLAGCKIYDYIAANSYSALYLYQECGTPIDENTIDSTKLQWAYVLWVQESAVNMER